MTLKDPQREEAIMAIVKWTLFNELDPFERRMQRLFGQPGFVPQAPVPAADVYETPDEYVVALDVPGYEEKELAVELSDHTLAIKGQRSHTTDEAKKEFALQERLEHQFERRFTLPMTADTEHVKARFTKGVLEVHTPKVVVSQPKNVAITTG
jgi:HSP20 family protein